jgi:hypothetical protein
MHMLRARVKGSQIVHYFEQSIPMLQLQKPMSLLLNSNKGNVLTVTGESDSATFSTTLSNTDFWL